MKNDHVLVKWEYEDDGDPVNGYYVAVQLVNKKGATLGPPHFVHVDGDKRKTHIRGLKPRALYQMKVVTKFDAKTRHGCDHTYVQCRLLLIQERNTSPAIQ